MVTAQPEPIIGVETSGTLHKWSAVLDYYKEELPEPSDRGHWIFRGEKNAEWKLKSSFERDMGTRGGNVKPWQYEAGILREFTRRAHHYVSDLPPANDILEWFALMRHYGAPCRLVDFTYSFYVAAYFALKNAPDNVQVAIWAINTDRLWEHYISLLSPSEKRRRQNDFRFKDPADFRRSFLNYKKPKTFVATVNPYRLNQRLTSQQGLFLCPGNINLSFEKNLSSCVGTKNELIGHKILVDSKVKEEALRDLRRMNISSATLFPGLEGFAQSLSDWFYLEFKYIDKDLKAAIDGKYPGSL